MNAKANSYQSYIVRMWRENSMGEWRASISDIDTGELRHFPNITTLLAYICQKTNQPFFGEIDLDSIIRLSKGEGQTG
ncbi:MAG TPA: hypothetical protein DEH22_16840 [Chloroflexi bacterium]|nr:hypothetical protein [Chloroflexota bacterium]